MANRFASPSVKRYNLDEYGLDDEWVEIKERLSYGEELKLQGAGIVGLKGKSEGSNITMGDEPEMVFDLEKYNLELFAMWIVDWSFKNGQDKHVTVSKSSIANLDPSVGQVLGEVIETHVKEYEERKKVDFGKKPTKTLQT